MTRAEAVENAKQVVKNWPSLTTEQELVIASAVPERDEQAA